MPLPPPPSKAYRIPHTHTCYHITVLHIKGHISHRRRFDNSLMITRFSSLAYSFTQKWLTSKNHDMAPIEASAKVPAVWLLPSRTWHVCSINHQVHGSVSLMTRKRGFSKQGWKQGWLLSLSQPVAQLQNFCFPSLQPWALLRWKSWFTWYEECCQGIKCSIELEAATVTLLI